MGDKATPSIEKEISAHDKAPRSAIIIDNRMQWVLLDGGASRRGHDLNGKANLIDFIGAHVIKGR